MSFTLFHKQPRATLRRFVCSTAGLVLLADAVFVMTQRVFHFGVAIPLLLAMVLLALAWRWDGLHNWLAASPRRRAIWLSAWAVFWLWLASLALFWTALAGVSATPAPQASAPAAAIVVLGSGTRGGVASPVLAARLDAALDRARLQPSARVVVSGGVDFNETVSEAQVMGDYLRAKGLAPSRITQEERSTSTEENLRFSRALLDEAAIPVAEAPVELVTSDFHTLRAGWIARRAGYANVHAVGAPTPLYVRYNAWLREYFAVLSGFLLREY